MPIDLSWYIPNRVIHMHVYGVAGAEQLQQMIQEVQPYLTHGVAPIHIILDDATAEPPPISLKQLRIILDVDRQPTEKIGWVIAVGDTNIIAKTVLPLLFKVNGIKHVRVNTVSDALSVLKKQDYSLREYEQNIE